EQFLGQVMPVLWEKETSLDSGIYSGLTDNYIRIFTQSQEILTNTIRSTKLVRFHNQGNQQVRWQLLPQAPDEYLRAANLPPIIAQLLYNRGVHLGEIEPFLLADYRLGGNPFLLPDMSQAVNRIYKALLTGEKIAIYGDFDVDGITATASLTEGLSWLGGKVTPYIPHRLREG
ncbi:unnamed protein product, partial [marine sediment metagenome]